MLIRLDKNVEIDTLSSQAQLFVADSNAPITETTMYIGLGLDTQIQTAVTSGVFKGKCCTNSDAWFYALAIGGWINIPAKHSKLGEQYILVQYS